MSGYNIVYLDDIMDVLEEEKVKNIINYFSCPMNEDVEFFIKNKAIEFNKHGYSKTQLVFTSYKRENVLVGYFTIANKNILVKKDTIKSNTLKKRINKFSNSVPDIKDYLITAPLIAQLGKNFTNGYNKLISGDELLKIALDQIEYAQKVFGGKFVYIECEDKPKLIEFYESNGFSKFNKRTLDSDEINSKSKYLIQLLKYM